MEWIGPITDSVAAIAVVVGIWFAYLQLRRISTSLTLMHQGTTVNVVAHCASRYEKVIRDMPKNADDPDVDKWWYRYWDLFTEEFTFFQKSVLDQDIFELWINELATVYAKPPAPGLDRRDERHKRYLQATLPNYGLLHRFFDELQRIAISEYGSAGERARRVHALVEQMSANDDGVFLPKNHIATAITRT